MHPVGRDSPIRFQPSSRAKSFSTAASPSYYCSFLTEHQQFAHLSGTKKRQIDDFVLPFYGNRIGHIVSNANFDCSVCDFRMGAGTLKYRPRNIRVVIRRSGIQAFRTFPILFWAGNRIPDWPDVTRLTQRTLMACAVCPKRRGRSFP